MSRRGVAILMRWCSRHSLQTQPWTYAALVPCLRSSRQAAASAHGLVRGPSKRRSGLHGIRRSHTQPASGSGCRGLPVGRVVGLADRSHRGPGATAAVSRAAQWSAQESHLRTTGGVTLHTAAAWRTEVTVIVSGTWSKALMPAWFALLVQLLDQRGRKTGPP